MNTISDSHNHLHFQAFNKDIKEVVERSFSSGVRNMLLVGTDPADSKRALETASMDKGFLVSVGIHPQNAGKYIDDDVFSLQDLVGQGKIAAVGETGFDLYRTPESELLQRNLFRAHIQLAKKLSLPLVIHDRDAHEKTLQVLDEEDGWQAGGVFHCFSGDVEMASKATAKGFYISVPGVVTFQKSSLLRDVVRMCPMEKLLVETDAPYLTPVPFRGKRNEPAYLVHTVEQVALIKGCTREDIARETTLNYEKLFATKK